MCSFAVCCSDYRLPRSFSLKADSKQDSVKRSSEVAGCGVPDFFRLFVALTYIGSNSGKTWQNYSHWDKIPFFFGYVGGLGTTRVTRSVSNRCLIRPLGYPICRRSSGRSVMDCLVEGVPTYGRGLRAVDWEDLQIYRKFKKPWILIPENPINHDKSQWFILTPGFIFWIFTLFHEHLYN